MTVTEGINIKFNLLGFVIPTERFKSIILTFLYKPTDIPQLCRSWDDNITDLVSGIPLKLLPIQEVNHEINLIDPEKCIHYCLLKCPEHFHEELSQKIERYTTAQWWIPAVAHQAVPMLCIPKKNSKLCTVFDL